MKGLLLGMMLTYGGLIYTGKVAAPKFPKLPEFPFTALAQAKTEKRALAAASTLSVTAALSVGNESIVKVQDSANGVSCYGALSASGQISSIQCLK